RRSRLSAACRSRTWRRRRCSRRVPRPRPARKGGTPDGTAQGDPGQVEDRREQHPARHAALARSAQDRPVDGPAGYPRLPGHDPHRPPPGPGRGSGLAMLKLHDLRPAPGAHKEKQRLGRGEGSKGKTAGRGTKGTKARYQVPAEFETVYQIVNVGRLAELFPTGGEVTPETLAANGAVRGGELVKVLGDGEV